MRNAVCHLQNQVRALLETGGKQIPAVTPYRFTAEHIPMPRTERPYLYIVLDGVLRLHTPSGMMDYMAGQYSISRIDTPLSGTVLAFSHRQDFLAVSVEFQPSQAVQTILSLDNELTERIMSEQMEEQEAAAADRAVLESVSRLLDVMTAAVPSTFIHRQVLGEVLCYALCGSCGKQLIQSIANVSQADEIYRANSWIKENFRDSFAVEELALSVTLVPGKAYTAAVTQCRTKDVAGAAAEGAPLMAIQTNDPRITLVAGGYPLFVKGKIAGVIGVGGGTEVQDCEIAEYVLSVFEKLTA